MWKAHQQGRAPGKVLVVLGSPGIGDAVEALPVFDLIREHWPAADLAAGSFNDFQIRIFKASPAAPHPVRLLGRGSIKHHVGSACRNALTNYRLMRGYHVILFL